MKSFFNRYVILCSREYLWDFQVCHFRIWNVSVFVLFSKQSVSFYISIINAHNCPCNEVFGNNLLPTKYYSASIIWIVVGAFWNKVCHFRRVYPKKEIWMKFYILNCWNFTSDYLIVSVTCHINYSSSGCCGRCCVRWSWRRSWRLIQFI